MSDKLREGECRTDRDAAVAADKRKQHDEEKVLAERWAFSVFELHSKHSVEEIVKLTKLNKRTVMAAIYIQQQRIRKAADASDTLPLPFTKAPGR